MNAVLKFEAGPLALIASFDVRGEFGLKRFENQLARLDTVGQVLNLVSEHESDHGTKALWHVENDVDIAFESTRDVSIWWSKQTTLGREVHKRKRKVA